MDQSWRERITIEPGKRGERPCVRGMRITVYDMLSYFAADDVLACLAFAAEREHGMLVAVA